MASLLLMNSGPTPRNLSASGMLIWVPSFSVSALPASMMEASLQTGYLASKESNQPKIARVTQRAPGLFPRR